MASSHVPCTGRTSSSRGISGHGSSSRSPSSCSSSACSVTISSNSSNQSQRSSRSKLYASSECAPLAPHRSLAQSPLSLRRALVQGVLLRQNGSHLPRADFEARRSFLSGAYTSGKFLKDPPPSEGGDDGPTPPPNPLTDPSQMEGMMDMMKKQMVMFVPQTIIMGWINLFFSGFVLSTFLPSL
jgi:hypothetical protein